MSAPERELTPAELLELHLVKVRKAIADAEDRAFAETPRPLLSSAQLAERVERQRAYVQSRAKRVWALSDETRASFRGRP